MKVNSINTNRYYLRQNFKAQSYKNSVDIKFDKDDMERGSIVAGLAGIVSAGTYLTKTNEKNLVKAGVIGALIIAGTTLATIGAITSAKIFKKLNENKTTSKQD